MPGNTRQLRSNAAASDAISSASGRLSTRTTVRHCAVRWLARKETPVCPERRWSRSAIGVPSAVQVTGWRSRASVLNCGSR